MSITRSVISAAALALALVGCGGTEADVAASDALAGDVCQPAVAELRADVQLATFRNARDLTGLVGKLDAASVKLNQGKFQDAIQKLNDFRGQVVTLSATGKLGPSADGTVTADLLVAEADAAIACIQALLPPAL